MDKNNDAFSKEYPIESSTDAPSKTAEEKEQDETIARKAGYYDKSKPYRVIIRAKEIE